MLQIEHPDITQIRRTGYPHGYDNDETADVCDVCGHEIDYDDVYDDGGDILCRDCILARYKRQDVSWD